MLRAVGEGETVAQLDLEGDIALPDIFEALSESGTDNTILINAHQALVHGVEEDLVHAGAVLGGIEADWRGCDCDGERAGIRLCECLHSGRKGEGGSAAEEQLIESAPRQSPGSGTLTLRHSYPPSSAQSSRGDASLDRARIIDGTNIWPQTNEYVRRLYIP